MTFHEWYNNHGFEDILQNLDVWYSYPVCRDDLSVMTWDGNWRQPVEHLHRCVGFVVVPENFSHCPQLWDICLPR